jgi:hypothetical protein
VTTLAIVQDGHEVRPGPPLTLRGMGRLHRDVGPDPGASAARLFTLSTVMN